ncbi:hypothetical protein WEI85_07430 [Actinomycetes bacterium KLBMP 9797]
MRLTVGPLPSAVYWRRRAVVLGALFIVLLVFFTTCRGSGGPDAKQASATSTPTTPAAEPSLTVTPEVDPTATTAAPTETSGPAQQGEEPPPPTTAAATPANMCTDAEIKVTPVPAVTSAPAGQTIVIRLRIRNDSDRACARDVGPDAQEIIIRQGTQVIWSSDRCGTARGSETKQFTPSIEHEYRVTWNGRQSTSCAGSNANGNAPKPGEYEVFGRLGTDLSTPVELTLT